MYNPKNLNRWMRPSSYFGAEWSDYYSSGFSVSRDSDALERANFDAALKRLGESETVIVVREGHWAVGWVQWIAIHADDDAALKIADELCEEYESYPVVDEDLYSEYEDADCSETWNNCYNDLERLEYLRSHTTTQGRSYSCWADIRAAVKGDWSCAAQILPCPSDLIH